MVIMVKNRPLNALLLCIVLLASCTPAPTPTITQAAPTAEPVPPPTQHPADASYVRPIGTAANAVATVTGLAESVSFYRLRLEYTSSSDWTTLTLLTPDHVLAIRQLTILEPPASGSVELTNLSLSQPLSAAETGFLIGLTVDVAVAPQAVDQPLEFLLQKGALNSSTVRVYLVDEEEISLLLEVDHQGEVAGSADTNPYPFTLDLSSLRDVPPRQAMAGRAEVPQMVWAFYYPWYSHASWSSNQLVDRPDDPYASNDPQAIARQIEQAQAAGIDGFICSWWGPGTESDVNLTTLLDLAAERDFKVAIYFETLDNGIGRKETEIFAWLQYALRTHGGHPAYMQVNGKPLVALWATEAVHPRDWQIVFNALFLNQVDATFIGMGYTASNLELFEGYHIYGAFTYPNLAETDALAARLATYYPLLMDHAIPKIYVATVQPGYDDHLLPDREGGQVQERLDGAYYRSTFEAALASDPDWIFITSWNEWWETTQIEPSATYGDLYLQLTREYVDLWKNP